MMKVSDLFRELSFGELSNLAISNSGSGTILEAKHPQLLHYANDALTAIYSRFLLSEKEIVIEMSASITAYHLKSEHSESVGTSVDLYIKDTPEDPFLDDALRILEVWGSTGTKYVLNDAQDPYSLFTPTPLVLQVPEPVAGQPLSILYQAKHAKLLDVVTAEVTNLLDQIIEIPHYLENALQQWIAHKTYSHMNGQENVLKGQEFLAAYEADCLGIEQRDLANQSWHTSHTKLEQRGFV